MTLTCPSGFRPRVPLGAALLAALALFFATVGLLAAQETGRSRAKANPPPTPRDLWFFFSPTQGDLTKEVGQMSAVLEKHPDLRIRPCLLVDDFKALQHPSDGFAKTLLKLRSLRGLTPEFSISVWDEEGLALAREIGVDRLPTFALLEAQHDGKAPGARRAHVAVGRGAPLEEMISCP